MGRYYNRTGNPVESVSADGITYVSSNNAAGNPLPFGSGQLDMFHCGTSYVVPYGVAEIRVTCMGAGGVGDVPAIGQDAGGGGGGGGFAQAVFAVTPGQIVNYTIGADIDYENGTLTATAGGDGEDIPSGKAGGIGGVGGGTASPIITYSGGVGGKGEYGGGGGNGLCRYIGSNVSPDGGAGDDSNSTGGGGVFGGLGGTGSSHLFLGSGSGDPTAGVSTAAGFFSNYTSWSVLDKNSYNSTKGGNPGVGGSVQDLKDGGFGAGGAGNIAGVGGAGGVGGGSGAGKSSTNNYAGIAMILIEY